MNFRKTLALLGCAALMGTASLSAQVKIKDGNKIAFMGDSITQFGHNYAAGYVNMVMIGLKVNGIKADFVKAGISGNRSTHMLARLDRDVISKKPQVMTLSCGVNDVWHEISRQNGVDAKKFEQVYRMLLEWTRKELPETKIILLEPYVLPFGAVEPNWIPEMAERSRITEKMSKEFNTAYVPLQSLFNDALKRAPQEYWLKDGVHPTLAGHKLISNAWLKAAEPYLQ